MVSRPWCWWVSGRVDSHGNDRDLVMEPVFEVPAGDGGDFVFDGAWIGHNLLRFRAVGGWLDYTHCRSGLGETQDLWVSGVRCRLVGIGRSNSHSKVVLTAYLCGDNLQEVPPLWPAPGIPR